VGGIVSMAVGAVAGDAVDRLLASHALNYLNADGSNSATAPTTANNGSDGKQLFADVPPTSGSYQGLFNATAVLAPMNATRWLVGIGAPIAIYAASFVFSKTGSMRAVLQLGAFGWGVRTLLKGANQAAASLFGRTHAGARLYDAEARAAAVQAANQPGGTDNSGLYPTSGLGRGRCDCPNCTAGVGACCAGSMNRALSNQTNQTFAPGPGQQTPTQAQPIQPPMQAAPQSPSTVVNSYAPPTRTVSPSGPSAPPALNQPQSSGGSPYMQANNPNQSLFQGQSWQGVRGVPRARSPYEWSLVHEGQ
jgi:hypothetical protein